MPHSSEVHPADFWSSPKGVGIFAPLLHPLSHCPNESYTYVLCLSAPIPSAVNYSYYLKAKQLKKISPVLSGDPRVFFMYLNIATVETKTGPSCVVNFA